jgi:hypothetical protein
MNFKQAVEEMKKGKKVRRKGWKDVWFTLDNGGALLRNVPGSYNKKATITGLEPLTLESVENVYANDWEVVGEKKKWWEPELDEKYYIIRRDGGIDYYSYEDDETDKNLMAIGNCFHTEEQADFMVEKLKVIHELEKFAFENNTEEIDWDDINQAKYHLVGVFGDKGNNYIKICSTFMLKELPFNIYFISKEIARKAIETIGEDRIKKYYFGVDENGRK